MTASTSFPALGSTATVCVTRADVLELASGAVGAVLAEIDRACSRFRPDSELVELNAAAGRPVQVSETLFGAVEAALRAAALTGGLVDPTVGKTLRLAGYDRDFELVSARRAVSYRARFASVPGWRAVRIDGRARTVMVPRDAELDLGATAKALAADRAAAGAAAAAGCGVLVSLGGDIAVAGTPPENGWPVRIADDHRAPLDTSGPTVALRTGGLASSSTTVRRWRAGEAELHHIVDPRTGRPATTPWRTVTVAAGTCVDANTASTAAVILGDHACEWLAERGLHARLVAESALTRRVGGWPAEAA